MKKILSLLYGLVSYLALGQFFVCHKFVGNIIVSKTIDSKPGTSLVNAILVDASLLLLFALQQHMARPAFKRRWTQIVLNTWKGAHLYCWRVFA
jgi:hypothetical protein